MEGRQDGKLVTYICPTCGTALKFEQNKRSTTCPSCKNEVEKQFVVNLNFVSTSDDENFKNCYSYDKSLFKFNFESKMGTSTGIKKREFIEIPTHRLTPNEMIELDNLIQGLTFKMDKPNKLKDTNELFKYANDILSIDDNNVYGVFLLKYLKNESLTDVLSRRDSLDKADFFIPYLMTNNKVLYRTFDEDITQIITYILNCNLKTSNEKYEAIRSVYFDHLKEKHFFSQYSESIFILTACDISLQLKQNIVRDIIDISILNSYESLVKYIKACLSVKLNIDNIFAKNKLKLYIYGLKGAIISNLIEYIWSLEELLPQKRMEYLTSLLDQFLFASENNMTAQECASLIDVLKNKPLKPAKLKKYLERIVLLSLVEKVDVDGIEKIESKKIKRQIKANRKSKPKTNGSLKDLWSFWDEYWWKKPYKICCAVAFVIVFGVLVKFNFHKVSQLFTDNVTEAMSALGLAALCSLALFIPLGALLNILIAPIKWLTLYFTTKVEYGNDIKVKRMSDRKEALILKAEKQNKDLKTHEEFENARLIAYLVEVDLDDNLKHYLIELIKTPYTYEPYDEVLNLIDLINHSNYTDKEQLVKFLILNCINLNSYKEALTTLEFIKRLNLPAKKREEYTKYLLYNKAKKSLTSVTGYLYLFSYLENEIERFKYMFSIICTYNKDLFYELNNIDVAYSSGDISDDLYLLVCKSIIKFAFNSVSIDHLPEIEKNIKVRLNNAGISDFSMANKAANAKIINWVSKKPLTEKTYYADKFLRSHIIK
ncbi:MAG: hypothetical protein IJW82_05300 [Clostridia bacterium]|nr:hypothetical protein [Clostridia bacterium]